MTKVILTVVAVACVALGSAPVRAGKITVSLAFDGSDFADIYDNRAAPHADVSGSFSATFDPAVLTFDDTRHLVVLSFAGASVGSRFSFDYFPTYNRLYFGGRANGANIVEPGTNDFSIGFDLTDPAAPRVIDCADPGQSCGKYFGDGEVYAAGYTTRKTDTAWFARAAHAATLVPEPRGLMLVGAGLTAVAAASRRVRRGKAAEGRG